MKKYLSIVCSLVLAVSLLMVPAAPAAAAGEVWVDASVEMIGDGTSESPFLTIKEGITAVDEGGTVHVAAGTYVENITINKSLTLQGAGKADTVIDAGGAQHGIKIQTDPLNYLAVKDLTVQNAWSRNIYFYSNADEVVIENVDLSCSDPTYDHSAGFEVHQKTVNTLLVKGCTFENIKRYGVRVDSTGKIGHLTVIDSDFSGKAEDAIEKIDVSQAGIESCGNIDDLTVSGSTFTGTVNGIRLLWYWSDGTTTRYSIEKVDIKGSTFEGTDAGFFFCVGPYHPTHSSVVPHPVEGYEIGDIQIHDCSFTDSNWGVNFDDTGMEEAYKDVVIDAANNWWGDDDGPSGVGLDGNGDAVSENVIYWPWLPAAQGTISGAADLTATYYVPPMEIGISVDPTWVDFGDVVPGDPSTETPTVTVTNEGNVAVNLTAEIINESPPSVYTGSPGLEMGGGSVAAWGANVAPAGIAEPSLVLTVPFGTAPGTYTATLVFWAEAS